MNIKKTLAAFAAAAVAASMLSVSASAIDMSYYIESGNNMVYVKGGSDAEPSWVTDNEGDLTSVYGVKYTLSFKPGAKIAGKIITNAKSSGWNEVYSWSSADVDVSTGTASVEYLASSAVFTEDEEYAQFALQSSGADFKVVAINILDKDGNAIGGETAPIEVETSAEEETAAETEAAEESTEEAAPAEVITGNVLSDAESTSSNWGQAVKLLTVKNDGGIFDPTVLTEDTAVVVYYEADTAPEVILQSWSGGEGWAKVPANEDYSTDGRAVFTWDYMTAMYQSEDLLDTLDCFYVGDTGCDLKVTKVELIDAASLAAGAEADDDVIADAETETETVTQPEAVEDVASTPVANTGNTAVASIAAVMALAGAAAFVSKKK